MSPDLTQIGLGTEAQEKPLNPRQRAFGRELGIAMARGDRNFAKAYAAAGFAEHRGNAARLAADPRVRAIADQACEEAARLNGLHIGYLQAKAMQLLDANLFAIHWRLSQFMTCDIEMSETGPVAHPRFRSNLTAEEIAELERITWPLGKLEINEKGVIKIDIPDKKSIIEMLGKQLGHGNDKAGDVNVTWTLEQLVVQSIRTKEREAA